jgi:hypothetical protein
VSVAIRARLPVLAICVPTFNRAANLGNLFRSLAVVKEQLGDDIEICVSNNGSTDDTRAVIEEFGRTHEVIALHQPANFGATVNIIAVAGTMRARWGIWCGDDDEVDVYAIRRIVDRLRSLAADTWVLVDSADLEGQGQYMHHFLEGEHTAARFKRAILRSGLDPFGFMGVHVFPRSAALMLQEMKVEDTKPWPPIVAMLRFVMRPGTRVHVLREIAIMQAKGGAVLFWNGGDLARIRIAKLRLLWRTRLNSAGHGGFLRLMMLREMYSLGSLKAIAAWKLYEGEDYKRSAVNAYLEASSWMGVLLPLAIPYALLALTLMILPHRVYAGFFRLTGQGGFLSRYQQLKRELGVFDGIKRGL